ncbi:MAG TPA: amidohydrolase [Candidatus Sulfotelmatobacter sp.]|jgi:aminobenzoyl-glutamate utilization protein B|nr:amidohydrolase [Candidatus Sulfotelmatobacter sp.]
MQKRFSALVLFLLLAPILPAQNTPSLDALKREAVEETDKLQTFTQQMVDQIFSYSELGFQEFETSRYVTGILEKNGFKVEKGIAGIPTAWVASYGNGKPIIAFITDEDCIPRASQKPGVAYHEPIVEGAPGHGEGHNSGMAVNVTAALVLKKQMEKYHLSGTIRIFPGIAEELVATKAFYVRAGYFKDVDLVLGSHVSNEFSTSYSTGKGNWSGLVSIQYFFHGKAAHAAVAPWEGRSALDAVELMDTAWDFNREHFRLSQRSHRVIINGGDQPNVVPSEAAVWYYFRELDYPHIKSLYELGNTVAESAAKSTGTTVDHKLVGSAWPPFLNKVIAETQQKNIEAVGMPAWTDADQALAKALQKEIGAKVEGLKQKVEPLNDPAKDPMGGGSDDIGDISWNVPMVYLMFPANIPNLPGHSWPNAVAMATPIAHKGSNAGAKVQALTALDFLLRPELVTQAWDYFHNVQTKDVHYEAFLSPDDKPAIEFNKEKMQEFLPDLKKFYYDPSRYKTYLEQLGITYPTVHANP